jgi:hypothetical protein
MDMMASSIEILLPPLGPINIAKLNCTMNWVRVTIHWHLILIMGKTIWEIAIQNKHRHSPGSPCTTKHGTLRHYHAARDTIRRQKQAASNNS